MMEKQEAYGQGELAAGSCSAGAAGPTPCRWRLRKLPVTAAALAVVVLSGCAAVNDMAQSPEQAAAEQPQKVSAEGAKDEFPSLSEVPEAPQPHTAPEDREKAVAQMTEDRNQAEFTAPPPIITAAGRDIFAGSTIITSDSVTSGNQVAGLPLETAAGGQLAAIIFFPNGSAALDAKDRGVLRDLARLLEQRGGSLRLVGHASSWTQNTTPDEHQLANFEMSLARANSVAEELLRLGVAPDAVQTEAVGDAEPVYHEFMPSGEAGNRRVEIFLEN
jgi:flagellar motor protein MotB